MRLRSYPVVCALVAVGTALVVALAPGVSDTVEGMVLGFLSRNAG